MHLWAGARDRPAWAQISIRPDPRWLGMKQRAALEIYDEDFAVHTATGALSVPWLYSGPAGALNPIEGRADGPG